MANESSLRQQVSRAFRWMGFGTAMIMLTLFGTVSADEATVSQWQYPLLGFGGLGILFILISFGIFLVSFRHLQKEDS